MFGGVVERIGDSVALIAIHHRSAAEPFGLHIGHEYKDIAELAEARCRLGSPGRGDPCHARKLAQRRSYSGLSPHRPAAPQ
jgi:hypothetical protein